MKLMMYQRLQRYPNISHGALDKVKSIYADKFEKVYYGQTGEEYYKLPIGDYYLSDEGLKKTKFITYIIYMNSF